MKRIHHSAACGYPVDPTRSPSAPALGGDANAPQAFHLHLYLTASQAGRPSRPVSRTDSLGCKAGTRDDRPAHRIDQPTSLAFSVLRRLAPEDICPVAVRLSLPGKFSRLHCMTYRL
jgi:hypothetical protein